MVLFGMVLLIRIIELNLLIVCENVRFVLDNNVGVSDGNIIEVKILVLLVFSDVVVFLVL